MNTEYLSIYLSQPPVNRWDVLGQLVSEPVAFNVDIWSR